MPSTLEGVNLCDAHLQRASLREACLFMADLRGANLYLADLGRANLAMADLRGADLSRANLCGTDLRGTSLTPELLRGRALFDDSSKFGDCDLKECWRFPRQARSILFLLDAGSATAEEIAELFGLISDFNRALGGYGCRFEHGPQILTEATPIRTAHQMDPPTEDVSAAEAETAALVSRTSERTGTRGGRRFRCGRRSVSAILATCMSGPDGQPTRVDRVAGAATVMACHRVLEDRRAFNGKTETLAGGPVDDRDSRLHRALEIVSKQQLPTSRAQRVCSLSDSVGVIRWVRMPTVSGLLSQLLDNELFEDHPVIADGLERLGSFYRHLADTRQMRLTYDIRWPR